MTHETDRVAVPTNGRKPHQRPSATAAPAAPDGADPDDIDDADDTSDAALSVAFSPKQLAIGFGILASLVLLAAGAARRRSRR